MSTADTLSEDISSIIARLNDDFRMAATGAALGQVDPRGVPGRFVITAAVNQLPADEQIDLITKLRLFNRFNYANDPHGEHNFGIIEYKDETYNWRIDYYDKSLQYGSEDPSDPEQTTRVMTLMHRFDA